MRASAFLSILGLASPALAAYVIQDDYDPSSFFSQFNFFTVSLAAPTTDGRLCADENSLLTPQMAT